jgi:hypothetical protein
LIISGGGWITCEAVWEIIAGKQKKRWHNAAVSGIVDLMFLEKH